jgi:hypothetical protein
VSAEPGCEVQRIGKTFAEYSLKMHSVPTGSSHFATGGQMMALVISIRSELRGYKGPKHLPRLSRNELVARRIEELQTRNEEESLLEILPEVVHATRARLSGTSHDRRIKTAEMLAKMCGWNEPSNASACERPIRRLAGVGAGQ